MLGLVGILGFAGSLTLGLDGIFGGWGISGLGGSFTSGLGGISGLGGRFPTSGRLGLAGGAGVATVFAGVETVSGVAFGEAASLGEFEVQARVVTASAAIHKNERVRIGPSSSSVA